MSERKGTMQRIIWYKIMIKIGITGGIGSGKSTVCKIFKTLNIPVYNADIAAAVLTARDKKVKSELIKLFGSDIYDESGFLKRKKMASKIFNNKSLLTKVNNIIHPAVFSNYQEWCKKHSDKAYTLKEAAILFESHAHKHLDKIITVFADQELRIQRVMQREDITKESVIKRMNNQMPENEKIKRSNFIIYNNEKQLVIPQVIEIHTKLIGNLTNR